MPDKAAWSVNTSVPSIDLDPATGKATRGYRVHYTISPSGLTDSIFIPAAVYGKTDEVKAMIADAVRKHNAVTGLSG